MACRRGRAARGSIPRPARRHIQAKTRHLQLEQLEARELLAADTGFELHALSRIIDPDESFAPVSSSGVSGLEDEYVLAAALPALSSNPSATAKLYLDFDGHFDAQWGAYSNVTTPAWTLDSDGSTFNAAEIAAITEIWQRVAEDFAPFNIDVTTVDPGNFNNRVGMRVAIGGNGSWFGSAGGVAYIDTWTNSIVNTVYVFSSNLGNIPKYIAEASSHESGHGFGLRHQSSFDASGNKTDEYNPGSGDWAPIMGLSYYKAHSTWHNGPTTSATTFQDDMATISRTQNGFGYRADDHGDITSPTPLDFVNGQAITTGIIEQMADQDVFSFTSSGGETTITLDAAAVGANLDSTLELRTAAGILVASASPANSYGATISQTLTAGNYVVIVGSAGQYGSVGQFTLTVDQAVTPLLELSIAASAISEDGGTSSATINRSGDTSNALVVTLSSSDTSEATVPDSVTIAAGESSATFMIAAVDDSTRDGTQTIAITASATGFAAVSDTVDVTDDEVSIDEQLVAYWTFDEGSGPTAADSSLFGGDNPGTLEGASWSSAGLNGSVSFDGQLDHVAVNDTSDINLGLHTDETISLWFRATSTAGQQVIYEQGGSTRGLNIYLSGGRLYVGGWNTVESNWNGTFLSTNQVTAGRWHHVALVLSGGPTVQADSLIGYLNGVEFGRGAGSQLWQHADDVGIGRVRGTTRFDSGASAKNGDGFAGEVDDVRIYGRAVPAAQIQQLAEMMPAPKVLSVSLTEVAIDENGGSTTATVTRTGSTLESLVVTLGSSDTSEATVPATITVAAGQSSATFSVSAVDDDTADGSQMVAISAAAAGFDNGYEMLEVMDNEVSDGQLVAHWTFNEGSGATAADTSPHGSANTGTLVGAGWSPGGLGGAVSFDGVDSHVAVEDTSDINLGVHATLSISLWFQVNDASITTRHQVIYEQGGSSRGLNIHVHGGRLYVAGWNAAESNWSGTFLSTNQIASGTWHHVALVLNGGPTVQPDALIGYLDGSEFARGAGSQLWNHANDIGIGRVRGDTLFDSGPSGLHGDGLAGLIDEVRVYGRALSPAEVQGLADETLDDVASISVSLANSVISENGGTTTGTVTRTGSTSEAVVVNLSSSDTTEATVPASVTIAPGQSSATFAVTGVDDNLQDGTQTVSVVASASGLSSTSVTLQVSDNESPTNNQLVAYWTFNEGSGTAAADTSPSGTDNSATLEAGAGWSSAGLGGAVSLDGIDAHVAVPDSTDINLGIHATETVALWFRVTDASSSQRQVIYEQGGSSRGLNIYVNAGQLYVGGWNSPESNWSGTFLTTNQISEGIWQHVALVLDGGTTVQPDALIAYLDGDEFGRGAGSQLWQHANDTGIGRVRGDTLFHNGVSAPNADGFAGLVDDVRIYSRALAAFEINQLAAVSPTPSSAHSRTSRPLPTNPSAYPPARPSDQQPTRLPAQQSASQPAHQPRGPKANQTIVAPARQPESPPAVPSPANSLRDRVFATWNADDVTRSRLLGDLLEVVSGESGGGRR